MKKIEKATKLNHDTEAVILDGVEYFFISYYLGVVCLVPYLYNPEFCVQYVNCVNDVPERDLYVL